MTDILTDFSDAALTTAIEANLFEMLGTLYDCLPNPVYREEADATWFMSDLPFVQFNGVIHARLAPEGLDTRIREILANFKAANKSMVWWTGPSTLPNGLSDRLQACGLLYVDDTPGMVIDLSTLDGSISGNPAVTVKRVASLDDLRQWVGPFTVAFEASKKIAPQLGDSLARLGFDEQGMLHHYIGMLNGHVVGTSTLYLGAGVAGIYNVGTLPKARRQGVAAALVLAPLRMARDRGYRVGILHSTEMGHGVYRRIGFKDHCTISHYLYMPNPVQRGFVKVLLGADRLIKKIKPSSRS